MDAKQMRERFNQLARDGASTTWVNYGALNRLGRLRAIPMAMWILIGMASLGAIVNVIWGPKP